MNNKVQLKNNKDSYKLLKGKYPDEIHRPLNVTNKAILANREVNHPNF